MSLDLERPQSQPVTSVSELVAFFERAGRPASSHQIGLEHEKLVFRQRDARSAPYEEDISRLLRALEPNGHHPFREGEGKPVIALLRDGASISLEPGGQLELSGAPHRTAREAHAENLRHLEEVRRAAGPLGLQIVALGYRPFEALEDVPWMPKTRYEVMRRTLGARGSMALDMMLMTATGQVSLDWENEADCAAKVTCAARVAPLMVALYANSPLVRGRPSGYLSFRSHVWTDVDSARCGYRPWMIDGSFSYRQYVDWALDAPLLFLRRDAEYHTPKMTFRELMARGYEGTPALQADWVDHLSTLFPEVRLKKVIEIRGADSVGMAQTAALAALWRGLFYDGAARAEASGLLPRLTFAEHLDLHAAAGREGLAATVKGTPLSRWARELVEIARRGLKRLDPEDVPLLDPLADIAASGRTPAERVLAAYEKDPRPEAVLREAAL